MDLLMLILRLVHIVFGAVWVGFAVFAAFFLMPAMQEAGPDSGKVMAALTRRGIMTLMPILAFGTMLSGLWMYWRASAGFQSAYLTSRFGGTLALGATLAILAFALGMTIVRPSMLKAVALTQNLGPQTPAAEREQVMAETGRLRARSAAANRYVALLLVAATAAMAVARYL